jgi:hypothetical protein
MLKRLEHQLYGTGKKMDSQSMEIDVVNYFLIHTLVLYYQTSQNNCHK